MQFIYKVWTGFSRVIRSQITLGIILAINTILLLRMLYQFHSTPLQQCGSGPDGLELNPIQTPRRHYEVVPLPEPETAPEVAPDAIPEEQSLPRLQSL